MNTSTSSGLIFFVYEQVVAVGILASLAMVDLSSVREWSGGGTIHCFKNCWDVIVDDVHGSVTEKSITFIVPGTTDACLQPWIGVHIFGYGVDEDPDHFVTIERHTRGELWRLPYVKLKWSRESKSAGEKPSGVLKFLWTMVSVVAGVATTATVTGAVSEGVYQSPVWLVAHALFAVELLVVSTKVNFYRFDQHYYCSDAS